MDDQQQSIFLELEWFSHLLNLHFPLHSKDCRMVTESIIVKSALNTGSCGTLLGSSTGKRKSQVGLGVINS